MRPSSLLVTLALFGPITPGPALAQQLPASCLPSLPSTCTYSSDIHANAATVELELTDPARNGYRIPLLVRYPLGIAGKRPVVIWNHGGEPSENGRQRSAEWVATFAEAGYIVIHPSRPHPDPVPYEAECFANGFKEECADFLANHRFGPLTTHFLLDNLALIEAAAPVLAGKLDGSKVVIGGHSAGTTTALANAGAWQQYRVEGPRYQETDLRPLAFIATAPQGPLYAGFTSGFQPESYGGISRPFLFVSGVGDLSGEPSVTRTTAFLTAAPGRKYLSWDTSSEAVHETMDIDNCDTPLRASHCAWIASLGLAFVDAVVRGRAAAIEWLDSDAYQVLTGGAIELFRR